MSACVAAWAGLDIGQNKRGDTMVRGLTEWRVERMEDVVRGMDLASSHRAVGMTHPTPTVRGGLTVAFLLVIVMMMMMLDVGALGVE